MSKVEVLPTRESEAGYGPVNHSGVPQPTLNSI